MPEFATEVEVQVVGGADDGAGGERFVGTGEPIEVPSSDSEPVRRRPLDQRLRAGVHRRRAGLLRLISPWPSNSMISTNCDGMSTSIIRSTEWSCRSPDLTRHGDVIAAVSCRGATFLGVDLAPGTLHHVIDTGGVVFPDLPGLPFDAYRSRLYTSDELLAGWEPDVAGSFDESLDMCIYRWACRAPAGTSPSILDALARRLHDHAVDDALEEHLRAYPDVVAVMGGHGLLRTDAMYREVAQLGRSMSREGWHVATGGGPGAMEAANLGAWLAPADDAALDTALRLLAVATDFRSCDRLPRRRPVGS